MRDQSEIKRRGGTDGTKMSGDPAHGQKAPSGAALLPVVILSEAKDP